MSNKENSGKKQKFVIIGAITLLVIIILWSPFRNSDKGSNESTDKYALSTVDVRDPIVFKGNAASEQSEKIYIDPTKGELEEIKVVDKQEVKTGDPLLVYRDRNVETQIEAQKQAQARIEQNIASTGQKISTAEQERQVAQDNVNATQAALDAEKASANPNPITIQQLQADLLKYEAQVEAQDSAISALNSSLAGYESDLEYSQSVEADLNASLHTTVTAPFDGTVYVNEEAVTSLNAAVPVIEIYSPNTIVQAQISEYDFYKIHEGQDVTVTIVGTQEEVNGVITDIGENPISDPTAEASGVVNYSVAVTTEIPIQNGLSVQVSAPQNDLVVPVSAVVTEGDNQYVFVYEDSKVQKQQIEAVEKGGVMIIESGVKKGEQVISNPSDDMKDGDSVEVEDDSTT